MLPGVATPQPDAALWRTSGRRPRGVRDPRARVARAVPYRVRQTGQACMPSGRSSPLAASSSSSAKISRVGPSATTRPPLITMVRSQRSSGQVEVVGRDDRVCSNEASSPMSRRRARGSRPLEGSSMTRMLGSMASTVAMATARFSPPESR